VRKRNSWHSGIEQLSRYEVIMVSPLFLKGVNVMVRAMAVGVTIILLQSAFGAEVVAKPVQWRTIRSNSLKTQC
jgi:hypothetical protein